MFKTFHLSSAVPSNKIAAVRVSSCAQRFSYVSSCFYAQQILCQWWSLSTKLNLSVVVPVQNISFVSGGSCGYFYLSVVVPMHNISFEKVLGNSENL